MIKEKTIDQTFHNLEGFAHLAFFNTVSNQHDHLGQRIFKGHLICNGHTFALAGTSAKSPPSIHQCCINPAEPMQFFDLTVYDYATEKTVTVNNVHATGGDATCLTTNVEDVTNETGTTSCTDPDTLYDFSFDATLCKVDEDAREHCKKYFPNLNCIHFDDIVVCIGTASLTSTS
jgi:hypothetical protein